MFRDSLFSQVNVSKFADTFHMFIKSSHSQSITTASQAVTQSQQKTYINIFTINYQQIIHNTHNQI